MENASNVSTVTLELLRHGPRHNQLLSPLTQYLAVCGRYDPVTIHMPYEHQQMLLRLRALRYLDSDTTREIQLDEVMRDMGAIFGEIAPLMAGTVREARGRRHLIHLRFVYSAAELALLPFELAEAPNGFPGTGQPLLLQSDTPVCLTRETRRTKPDSVEWGRSPHIVFAFAQPELSTVPFKQHLRVLWEALSPWVSVFPSADPTRTVDEQTLKAYRREAIKERLTIVPQASLSAIQEACREKNPTAVHILAHGIQHERGGSRRFGLALHDAARSGKKDIVDERRLAEAFRPQQHPYKEGLASPTLVSLATCDSGGQGDVTGVGASLAHALHEVGIPLVVASQFPLTKAGSVYMAAQLYRHVLWGEDPRWVLSDVRRDLMTRTAENHDWASMTVYASFPESFEREVEEARFTRARESIEVALNDADRLTVFAGAGGVSGSEELLAKLRAKILDAKERLMELPDGEAETQGLLATTNKREAQILHVVYEQDGEPNDEVDTLLGWARRHYERAYLADSGSSWPYVQKLSLDAYLQVRRFEREKGAGEVQIPKISPQLWEIAKFCADEELKRPEPRNVAWGLGSLCELFILSPLLDGKPPLVEGKNLKESRARELAGIYAWRLVNEHQECKREIYSTYRQIRRYTEWFGIEKVAPLAEHALEQFPKDLVWG